MKNKTKKIVARVLILTPVAGLLVIVANLLWVFVKLDPLAALIVGSILLGLASVFYGVKLEVDSEEYHKEELK